MHLHFHKKQRKNKMNKLIKINLLTVFYYYILLLHDVLCLSWWWKSKSTCKRKINLPKIYYTLYPQKKEMVLIKILRMKEKYIISMNTLYLVFFSLPNGYIAACNKERKNSYHVYLEYLVRPFFPFNYIHIHVIKLYAFLHMYQNKNVVYNHIIPFISIFIQFDKKGTLKIRWDALLEHNKQI